MVRRPRAGGRCAEAAGLPTAGRAYLVSRFSSAERLRLPHALCARQTGQIAPVVSARTGPAKALSAPWTRATRSAMASFRAALWASTSTATRVRRGQCREKDALFTQARARQRTWPVARVAGWRVLLNWSLSRGRAASHAAGGRRSCAGSLPRYECGVTWVTCGGCEPAQLRRSCLSSPCSAPARHPIRHRMVSSAVQHLLHSQWRPPPQPG